MRGRERQRLERFKQVVVFVNANGALFAKAPPSYMVQVQALQSAVQRIEQGNVDWGIGTAAQTVAQRRALRVVLREKHLAPLRQVALVASRKIAGMEALVQVPKPTAHLQKLLDVSKKAVQSLEPYQEEIVSRGFPADFLQQLQGAIQAVEQVHSANVIAQQERAKARGVLLQAMREAWDAVRCLDLVVRRVCDGNPALGEGALAAWNAIVSPARRGDRRVNPLAGGVTAGVAGTTGAAGVAAAGVTD